MAMFELHGQRALVTGSTSGIGLEAARALARQGATVVLHGREPAGVQEAVAALRAEGHDAAGCHFDLGDLDAARAAIDEIEARTGPLHILFANAGIQHRAPLLEFGQPDFERILFHDLTSQWSLARHAAAGMAQRGYGRLIFTGSITALLGRPGVSAYTAAKAALHGVVRQWAAELTPRGVTVNALAPGYVRTQLTGALQDDAGFDAWLRERTPAGRWGEPQDIAAALVFLAARESGFVSGQTLVVDGGLTATML